MSNGYSAYKTYLAVKSHFTQDTYDYFKYGGKTRASVSAFERRSDRYFFEKLAKRYKPDELLEFFVSNFLMNDKLWIGDAFDSECDKVYTDWKRTQESITYTFGQDCEFMLNYLETHNMTFNSLFVAAPYPDLSFVDAIQYPPVVRMWLRGEIHVETLVLLDCVLGFMRKANEKLKRDFSWSVFYRKIMRYKPFVPVCSKPTKFKKLLQEKVSKHGVKA
jgi:hypothetical protein